MRNKTAVFGIVERGGDVITRIVPNGQKRTLFPILKEKVAPGSTVSTDTARQYVNVRELGFEHGAVNHFAEEYVRGIHHTNTIEGFWSRLKNSIRGTHIHVSRKHLAFFLRRLSLLKILLPKAFSR